MRFVIPQNQILKSVKLEAGPEVTIANYQPIIAPRQIPMSGASDVTRITPAWRFRPFPAQPIEIRTHRFRGITTVEVKVYPLQIRRREAVYFKDATVHIVTEERRDTPELQRDLVRDYEEAAALADNGSQFSPPSTASDSPIGYLIIGPSSLIGTDGNSPLQPLINEKRARGLTVAMATLESVSPSKDPAQIRAFIKTKYQQDSVDYVLLIGDKGRLPWKYLSAGGADAGSEPIPSDQYYACLDGTFDTPANYDWACEVAVGRIGAKTTQDVTNWVAKTLQLQQISQDATRNKKVVNFGEKLDDSTLGSWVMEYLVSGRNGTPQTVGFPQSTAWSKAYDTFSQEVSAGQFVNMINGGDIHIVNHLGHSNSS